MHSRFSLKNLFGLHFAVTAAIGAMLTTVQPTLANTTQPGINLAGCAVGSDGSLCPTPADVRQYVDAGFTMLRFGFKDTVPVSRIEAAVDAALSRGATVILDRHEYKWPGIPAQAQFWISRFDKYKGNQKVIFDLMNEPRGFDSIVQPNDYLQWVEDTRAIIAQLRTFGFTNPIAVEWPGNSAIFRFDKGEAANAPCISAGCAIDRLGGFGDRNVILSPHGYLDKGSSGTSASCDVYTFTASFATQARKRGLRAILGETAFGNFQGVPTSCLTVGPKTIGDMISAPDVYMGYTVWGGGREWPNSYIFAVAPKGATLDNPYVKMLLGK